MSKSARDQITAKEKREALADMIADARGDDRLTSESECVSLCHCVPIRAKLAEAEKGRDSAVKAIAQEKDRFEVACDNRDEALRLLAEEREKLIEKDKELNAAREWQQGLKNQLAVVSSRCCKGLEDCHYHRQL